MPGYGFFNKRKEHDNCYMCGEEKEMKGNWAFSALELCPKCRKAIEIRIEKERKADHKKWIKERDKLLR